MPETESNGALFEEFSAVDPAAWKTKVQSETGRPPEAFLSWSSIEGVTIPAYLHQDALDDAQHVDSAADLPPLAEAPDAPANEWVLSQPICHPDVSTANEQAGTAVDRGAEALDLTVAPSSGGPGLTIRTAEDLAAVLAGVDLSEIALHLGHGLAAPPLYLLLRDVLSERGIAPTTLSGSVAFDPIAVLTSGPSPTPPQTLALADQLMAEAATTPHLRSVTVDAQIYHDAGASAVQELAAILGALSERLAGSLERGHSLSTLLSNLQVTVPVSTCYFVEIAKLRALRLLVPQVVEAFSDEATVESDFGPSDLQLHAVTSRRTETIYDPYVNMLRATTEAMAAILGGCDVLTVRPYDDAIRPPDDFGLRIARNAQLILRHEAHFDQVADPAAGSYYIETMTDRLAQQAWTQFQELEAEGGIIAALRNGTLQEQIAGTRQARREAVDERTHILVGTTHYPALDERRRDDLADLGGRPSSNGTAVGSLSSPTLDAIQTALHEGATLPAITSALQNDESPIAPLPRIRVAEEIESIRLRTETYAETHDGPPQVLLAPLGPPAARSARATFARNFLGVAGFAIEEPLQFDSIGEAANTAEKHDADIVVLCSSNAEYPNLAPALASALEEHNHTAVLGIAGSPDDIDAVDHGDFFVHQGSPLQETLTTLQERLGMPVKSEP